MTQPRNTVSTCAAQWKMWLIEVFAVICFTAFCAAQGAEDVTSMLGLLTPTPLMPETTVTSAVIELPKPAVSLKSAWTEVFPSEKLEFTCTISDGSEWNIFWYRDDVQIQETGSNMAMSANRSDLTLTAEKQHSGKYSCKVVLGNRSTSSNEIYVKVYDSPIPTVNKSSDFHMMFPGESVTFTCTVDVSSGWEYVWYHNQKEIQASESNTYTAGSLDHSKSGQYRCKARRGNNPIFNTKETMTSLQISDPPTPSLKLLSRWSDVFENEMVKFSCDLNGSDWTFTWYKNNETLMGEDGPSLTITSITRTHQGVYTCKAHHNLRNFTSGISNIAKVTVYENTPIPTLRRNYGFNLMYVGEMVSFTCTVNVSSGWKYRWFKDKNLFSTNGNTINITLGPSDGGKYSCTAIRDGKTLTNPSEEITQNVLEIPAPSLKQSTQWLHVFPSESVKLTCGMEGSSDWTYTWHKDGQKVQADDTVSFESKGSTLSISAASAKHKGQYMCMGHIQGRSVSSKLSSGLEISVYDKKPSVTLTQDPEYNIMFPGESVTFRCHINVSSGWEYQWYKDENPLSEPLNMHTIDHVQASNAGSYKCRAKRGSDQAFYTDYSQIKVLNIKEKPKPSVTREPNTDPVYTGESVSFKCKVGISSGWDYHWYKDDKIQNQSNRLDIRMADATTNGMYKCLATRNKTKYETEYSDEQMLNITEIPVPILKQGSIWLDVFPTETVKLDCGITSGRSDWTYTWYKDGKEVQANNTVSFNSDKTTLSITSASVSQRGNYSCQGQFKIRRVLSRFSPEVSLHVYDKKPSVRLTQTPEHELMHTGDSVSFICHNNISSGWEYVWYKDDTQLAESGNNYTISSVVTTGSGSYKCQVKRGKNTVFHSDKSEALRLSIKERPQAEITLLTGWSEVFSTDTLILRCAVQKSEDKWNYTWYKEGQQINRELSEKYYVKPQDDPEQSLYTCQGIRTGRPSYSKPSVSFKTKNLLLKRRVLLSISGCIFFGIIAVFLGCIILRVCRKPGNNEDKLEEANLFLTMAQLKNCADAPCPLVDYVTEEALNAPVKEEDENGTICSEITPLPISTEEDQAVTTDNSEKEENGGLVSFKQ